MNRKRIILYGGAGFHDGDCITMTLTGKLKEEFGGRSIVGEDVVVILKK